MSGTHSCTYCEKPAVGRYQFRANSPHYFCEDHRQNAAHAIKRQERAS